MCLSRGVTIVWLSIHLDGNLEWCSYFTLVFLCHWMCTCVWHFNPFRFPGGIKKLARYLHDRGLRLGIYGDMGTYTCGGYPGTPLDKIKIDAQTFAEWEVDMFKYDGCYSNATEQEQGKKKEKCLFYIVIRGVTVAATETEMRHTCSRFWNRDTTPPWCRNWTSLVVVFRTYY